MSKRRDNSNYNVRLIRNRTIQFRLSEQEYNAIEKYCREYNISNRARWIRETLIAQIMDKYRDDAPTIFEHPDYIDEDNYIVHQFIEFDE